MEVSQLNENIFISQGKYTMHLLDKFEITNFNAISTLVSLGKKFVKNDGNKVDPTILIGG